MPETRVAARGGHARFQTLDSWQRSMSPLDPRRNILLRKFNLTAGVEEQAAGPGVAGQGTTERPAGRDLAGQSTAEGAAGRHVAGPAATATTTEVIKELSNNVVTDCYGPVRTLARCRDAYNQRQGPHSNLHRLVVGR